jgi:small subunit ribosomal protein S19
MSRSVWKGPFVDGYLLKKGRGGPCLGRNEDHQDLVAPQHDPAAVRRPDLRRHNGNKFMPVQVTENMVGHKFGEFAPTRTFTGHAADKKARPAPRD